MSFAYSLKNVVKSRVEDGVGYRLKIPEINIKKNEAIALIGHSGCGKSTLLDMLALALHPDESEQFDLGVDQDETAKVAELWDKKKHNELSEIRKEYIGYVLQTGGLLPYLTVRENIELPRKLLNLPDDDSIRSISKVMGIHKQLDKLPGLLSAGERQRASFARAFSHRPKILLADEPTASLDPITARKIMAVVMELVKGLNITMVIASHDWAEIYKMDFRSLHHEARVVENGHIYESIFKD